MMYILLAIVLMSLDQRGHYVPKVRNAMELAFEPVFRLVGLPSRAIQTMGVHSRARTDLIAENQQLQAQLLKY
jgi:rod shape-determining protein MreC